VQAACVHRPTGLDDFVVCPSAASSHIGRAGWWLCGRVAEPWVACVSWQARARQGCMLSMLCMLC
jgi:hypothetical protein